jgi:preflagellin peptidase FlaK
MIDTLKLLICISFLAYACRCDLRTRTVPNELWGVVFVAALPLVIADTLTRGIGSLLPLLIAVTATFLLVHTLFHLNAFGGADAKALIALSFIFPVFPTITLFGYALPLTGIPPLNIFAFSTLINTVLLTAIIPIAFLAHNLISLPLREVLKNPLYSLVGYQRVSFATGTHVRVLGASTGCLVWVMPGLPYMLPITAGFLVTIMYGGLLL